MLSSRMTPEIQDQVSQAYHKLEKILPVDFDDWMEAFEQDLEDGIDLQTEVCFWQRIASLFTRVATHFPGMDLSQKERALLLLINCSSSTPERVRTQFRCDRYLSIPQIEWIIREFYS